MGRFMGDTVNKRVRHKQDAQPPRGNIEWVMTHERLPAIDQRGTLADKVHCRSEIRAGRHAEPFSVNKSPNPLALSARFNLVDSCKQKHRTNRLCVAPTMKQSQSLVVRDSKDLTMSAVINRGGGRPSKGLRKYIGFRTPAKTAEDVQRIAAAKGMTVTDYVSSAVDRSLREDLALLDQFTHQDELPIRMAS